MSFCGNCGTKIEDGVKFCSGCGAATVVQAQQQQNVPPVQAQQQQNMPHMQAQQQQNMPHMQAQQQQNMPHMQAQQNMPHMQAQQPYQQMPPNVGMQPEPSDVTYLFNPIDIENNKVMGFLGYLIFFVPLLAAKDSYYAKFHANQGFGFFLGYVICSVLWIIPILGWIAAPICYIVLGVFSIIGMVNALSGKAKKLPIVNKLNIFK